MLNPNNLLYNISNEQGFKTQSQGATWPPSSQIKLAEKYET